MPDQILRIGIGMLVDELATCFREVFELDPEYVSRKLLQPLATNTILEQAMALVEVRLEDPPLGVVQ
ncbi:hypothetical protein [Streptomyces sp. NPDC060366]|uniref:hypothetical protein n=1 Tax=Streptomyces sp. NPDC060366 TaxID=3347105 RepID=UPI00366A3A03